MLLTLEVWCAKLGYFLERHGSVFFISAEQGPSASFGTQDEVVEFVLDQVRKECCS